MELLRALAALAEDAGPRLEPIAAALGLPQLPDAAHYTELFVLNLYPFASVYLGPEGMLGGEARDRIAGFWRALGLAPPPEPDHLTTLLALYAGYAEAEMQAANNERRVRAARVRHALFWEHLASWLPIYLARLGAYGSSGYVAWSRMLLDVLSAEAARLAPPQRLPLHLRLADRLPDPRAGDAQAFVAGLLAPARSGFILLRQDLERAARELGLGLRQGERRFALVGLLAQDRGATLRWIAEMAGAAASGHARLRAAWSPVAEFWERRARDSARLLSELAVEEVSFPD